MPQSFNSSLHLSLSLSPPFQNQNKKMEKLDKYKTPKEFEEMEIKLSQESKVEDEE